MSTSKPIEAHSALSSKSVEPSEFVSVSVVKQKLLRNDYHFEEGYTCLSTECFLCKTSARLYINKISGWFLCRGCTSSGSWSLLDQYLNKLQANSKQLPAIEKDPHIEAGRSKWNKMAKVLHCVQDLSDERKQELLERIQLPDLPLDVLVQIGARVDVRNQDLYFPLTASSENDQVEIVGYRIIGPDFLEETVPNFTASGLLMKNNTKKSEAIVVHSIRDFLVLHLHNLDNYDIICLPHGQYSLPQSVLPLLEHYHKLVLWFGEDVTSWENVRLFARKLFSPRCYLVRSLNDGSPFNAHKETMDLAQIVRNSQKVAHSSIVTFSNLRQDIMDELYNNDKVAGVKWTRFPTLNNILKGHRRGELSILTGPTGSGKTTFMSEYSLDLAMQKVTTLWGSFEIRNQRLARTMLQQMSEAPLLDNLDKFDLWADKFETLPIYFMTFHGQQNLETVMEAVKHASYVYDVAHLIIDNVQFMLGMSATESGFLDRFYRQDALIGAFRNFATTYNCHVTLVIHPRKEKEGESLTATSIFGGAKASQEADNILIIQNKQNQSNFKTRKYLQIAKNRFSGDLGMMYLDFDRSSLSFRAKPK